MAEYRTIRMTCWTDPYMEGLEPKEKLLYLYLFTNPHTNNLGVMNVSRSRIAFETGLNVQTVNATLDKMVQSKKVVIDQEYIWMVNFIKHQTSTSEKIISSLRKLFSETSSDVIKKSMFLKYQNLFKDFYTISNQKDTVCIGYGNGIDTVCIPSAEMEGRKVEDGSMKLEEELEEEVCAEVASPPSTPPSFDPEILSIPLVKRDGSFIVRQSDIDQWQETFPGVDVASEIRVIRQWNIDNPENRKTKGGIRSHISRWLGKEQNKAKGKLRGVPFKPNNVKEALVMQNEHIARMLNEQHEREQQQHVNPGISCPGDLLLER